MVLNLRQLSNIKLKMCLDSFKPRVFPVLSLLGINAETTRRYYSNDVLLNKSEMCEGVSIIFNGHLYDNAELNSWMGIDVSKKQPHKVIAHLYINFGIEETVSRLDGKFSFIIIDQRIHINDSYIHIVHDALGTQPLYILKSVSKISYGDDVFVISSDWDNLNIFRNFSNTELKCNNDSKYNISTLKPGSYSTFTLPMRVSAKWALTGDQITYNYLNRYTNAPKTITDENEWSRMIKMIQCSFLNAINKRCDYAEGTMVCILDGSFESVLITALVSDYCVNHKLPRIWTYCVNNLSSRYINDSEKYLQLEDYINCENSNISVAKYHNLTDEEFSKHSVNMQKIMTHQLIGKSISHDFCYLDSNKCNITVFCAVGSNSVIYGGCNHELPKHPLDFDILTRKSILEDTKFETFSAYKYIETGNNIQCVFPFMDNAFIQSYLSISPKVRLHQNNILKLAFSDTEYLNSNGVSLLPSHMY